MKTQIWTFISTFLIIIQISLSHVIARDINDITEQKSDSFKKLQERVNDIQILRESHNKNNKPKDDIDEILRSKIPIRSLPTPYRNRNSPMSLADLSPEEREERINRGFARLMQVLTFFGHIDNYVTGKASSFIKVMGKAMEGDNQEDERGNYNLGDSRSLKAM